MRNRADTGMSRIDLVDIGLHVSDEFLQILRWKILARQDHDRCPGQKGDRLEIFFRMIGKVGVKRHGRRMGAHMPRDQHISVIGSTRGASCSRGAAAPTTFSMIMPLAERLRHMCRDNARVDIGRTAAANGTIMVMERVG